MQFLVFITCTYFCRRIRFTRGFTPPALFHLLTHKHLNTHKKIEYSEIGKLLSFTSLRLISLSIPKLKKKL